MWPCDPVAASEFEPPKPHRLVSLQQKVEERVLSLDTPGAVVAIHNANQQEVFAVGNADDTGETAMPADAVVRLGSVSKLYLATVVLQLVDEGTLSLDTTIGDYVDGVPNGDRITLRMLGRHTSGLDDAIRQMPFHKVLAAEPARQRTPDELMRYAFEPGPRFEPGEVWAYGNTNSLLLALAIENATGKGWRDHVRNRFLEPLALDDTGFADMPVTVRGYRYGKPEDLVGYGGTDNHVWFDATDWSPSWTNAAGEMTGTATDTARFVAALFGGELLSTEMLDILLDFEPTEDDGDFEYGFHAHRIGDGYGHHGDVPGFSSSAVWLPKSKTAIVVLCNLSAELDKWSSASKVMETIQAATAQGVVPTSDADAPVLLGFQQELDKTAIQNASAVLIGDIGVAISGDADRLYRAGSVSKLLTALLVLRATEAGVVSLDDTVHQHLPGVLTGDGANDVTLAHLLEHTGGLAGSGPSEYATSAPGLLPSQYVSLFGPFDLRWQPGLHYSYSNPGYTVAAAVVERAWGDDFDTLMHREVLEPLGLTSTTFDAKSPPSFQADGSPAAVWQMPVRPAGSAVTTAGDLTKVVRMLLADGGDFLTSDSVARLERGETGLLADAGGGRGSYGLGTFAYFAGDAVLRGHWGKTEGFRATLMYDPDGMSGYVLLADTADDRGVMQLRRFLDRKMSFKSGTVVESARDLGAPIDEIGGLYVNHSHDGVQRAWLFSLLDARRLTPTDEGLFVKPLWIGQPTTWSRVGENLYRAESLPVASGATSQVNEDRFWVDGESYRRVSSWAYWSEAGVLVAGLVSAIAAPLALVVLLVRRVFGRSDGRSALVPFGSLALAGVAFWVLLIGFVYFQLGDVATIATLGRPSVPSLGLLLASLVGPVGAVVGLATLWRHRPMIRASLLALALPMVGLALVLAASGIIPLVGWLS